MLDKMFRHTLILDYSGVCSADIEARIKLLGEQP
jgi:hypothetical protein